MPELRIARSEWFELFGQGTWGEALSKVAERYHVIVLGGYYDDEVDCAIITVCVGP